MNNKQKNKKASLHAHSILSVWLFFLVCVLISIFCLFSSNAQAASRNPDSYEPNNDPDSASPISFGSIYPTLYPVGDADYFNVSTPSLGTLNIQVTNVPSDINIVLYVYGPNSTTTQRAYANAYSEGGNENVYFDCAPGFYIIRIYDYGNNNYNAQAYNLTVTYTPVSPDIYEYNSDATNATTISPGSHYPTIFPSSDNDWFNLTFSEYGTLTVSVSNVPSTLNPIIRLYGPNSTTQKASADLNGYGYAESIFTDIVPGYYYVRVYSYSTSDFSTSTYNLTITFSQFSPDTFEPNNDAQNASSISSGYYYPTIFPTGDVDWFNISIPTMGTLSVSVINVSSRLDIVLVVYGQNSSTIQAGYADAGSAGNSESLYIQVYQGYYYIKVYSYGNDDFATLAYNLTVKFTPVSPDIYEYNNDAQSAYIVSSGTYTPTIFPKGDIDWFNISIPTQGTLSVSVTSVPSSLDPVIYVYGPNSSTNSQGYVDYGGSGGTESIYLGLQPGYYYIKIYSYGNDDFSTANYTLTISYVAVPPDFGEPNNDFANASTISSGTYTPQIFPKGDNDYFNISCPEVGVLYVNVTNVPSTLDPVIVLYGPNSTSLKLSVDSYSSGSSEYLYTDVLPGYYYIRIYSYANDDFSVSNYTLQISYMPISPDIFEQNNDFANASLLNPGAYYPTIFPRGDKDYFNFSLPSQAKVYINVTQVPSSLNIIIVLYGPNATFPIITTVNSYSSGGSEYLYKELGPGFYYFQIYSSSSDDFSTAPYKLTFETNLPTIHNDAGTGADAGNNFTYATYLPVGNYLGNISEEDLDDYYKFNLLPSQVVYINFTSPVSGSCYIYIYDSMQSQELSSFVSNSATISIPYSSYQSSFFVRVYRYSGAGTYLLNVSHYLFQNDALSGGDARNNLSITYDPVISLGNFNGFVCLGDNNDYFVYYLQPNEAVYVNVSTNPNLDIYFYMYDMAGNTVTSPTYIPGGTTFSILYSPYEQYFFIRISRYYGYGTYALSVERWGFQNDASTGIDAGNNFTYATNSWLGSHKGLYCYGDNNDYYLFSLPIGQMVWINFTSQISGSGYIYIYNMSRVEITNAYSSSGNTKSITFLNTESSFYIAVIRNSGVGEYYLNITSMGYQNDAGLGTDAGNNFTYANSVNYGNYSGIVCYGDDNDYFNFSISQNEVVFVNVTALTSNIYVYIYDSLKNEIVNRYVSSASTQSIMYSSAPFFYVRIYKVSSTCDYMLNVTHYCYQNDASLACDASNTISGALNILYGSHLGILCFGDDNDYFAINMNAGETVYTNLTAPTTMNLYLYLYNSTGSQLYSGYCPSGSTISSSQTYVSSGVMKIRVYRSSGSGTYALSVTNAVTPPPTLSSGSVSPSTGETTTVFTFSVTYTELANNPPTYIKVYIDGTPHDMSKQNPSDNTYIDGCVYVYSTTLSSGSHNYYFETSNGMGNARLPTIGTYAGPSVGLPNTSPSLSAGLVSPTEGNTATVFVYTVVYTDVENTAPSYIRVYIDGTYYNMIKQNAGDNTYTDGCVYVYSTTLGAGNHDYYFMASDGSLSARLPEVGVYSGPVVNIANTAPSLTSGSVSPTNAVYGTNVTYSVTYTDAENAAPSSVIVYIDGTIHTMVKQNPSDNTYTDGCVYIYWTTTLAVGTHNYYFECSDGQLQARLPNSGTYFGPVINPENVAPILASGSVSPISGVVGTSFTYVVSYTDADNNAPAFIKVYIDGTSYDMVKQNPSDNTYTDGCIYTYITTLSLGNHNYYFECSDGTITVRLPTSGTYSGPEVTSQPVQTPFVLFSEVMYDPLGTENNEEWFELYNPTSVSVSLSGCYVRDNAGIFIFPTGTSISAGGILVVSRNSTAFYARYGFLPGVNGLNLSLSNTGDYLKLYSANGVEIDMVAWENAISGWTCSANENYTIARCPAGVDTNTSSDWVSNSYPSPGEVCTPNSPPSAVLLFAPTNATSSSLTLAWSMNNDNDFARYEIHKSTSSSFTIGANTLVATIQVRTTTSYVAIGLSSSTTYYFKVRVVDTGSLYADSNEVSGTTLGTNTPPILTNASVTPMSGTSTDTFTYTVTYYDAENNPPA
ncbi:MAG: lamin tail domain-containing protein, partial [Thermoplasmata archaeon]